MIGLCIDIVNSTSKSSLVVLLWPSCGLRSLRCDAASRRSVPKLTNPTLRDSVADANRQRKTTTPGLCLTADALFILEIDQKHRDSQSTPHSQQPCLPARRQSSSPSAAPQSPSPSAPKSAAMLHLEPAPRAPSSTCNRFPRQAPDTSECFS